MKLWVKNTLLVILLLVIVTIPLLFMGGNEFGGSDDAGADAVSEVDADFVPIAEPVWEPPSGEIESLLFCVQAAIGAGICGYAIGRLTSKKKEER